MALLIRRLFLIALAVAIGLAPSASSAQSTIISLPGFSGSPSASDLLLGEHASATSKFTLQQIWSPSGPIIFTGAGSFGTASQTYCAQDAGATAGIVCNVPTSSTNGYTFQVNQATKGQLTAAGTFIATSASLSSGVSFGGATVNPSSGQATISFNGTTALNLNAYGVGATLSLYNNAGATFMPVSAGGFASNALLTPAAGQATFSYNGTTAVNINAYGSSAAMTFYNNAGAGFMPFTGGTYTIGSDRRLKRDIHPLPLDCAAVLALKPVAFRWKSDGHDDIGFIAQDVQHVLPALVHGAPGGKLKGYLGVEYANVTAPIAACIQKQQSQIDALRADVNALRLRGIIHVTDPGTLPPITRTSFVERLRWLFTGRV